MQTTEKPALEAAHQALLECTEVFRAIRAASENGGDYMTLADIGERIAATAADALSCTG